MGLIGGVLPEDAFGRLAAELQDDAGPVPGLARRRPAVIALVGALAVLVVLLAAMALVGTQL